jgi:hypothetical protein
VLVTGMWKMSIAPEQCGASTSHMLFHQVPTCPPHYRTCMFRTLTDLIQACREWEMKDLKYTVPGIFPRSVVQVRRQPPHWTDSRHLRASLEVSKQALTLPKARALSIVSPNKMRVERKLLVFLFLLHR